MEEAGRGERRVEESAHFWDLSQFGRSAFFITSKFARFFTDQITTAVYIWNLDASHHHAHRDEREYSSNLVESHTHPLDSEQAVRTYCM